MIQICFAPAPRLIPQDAEEVDDIAVQVVERFDW